MKASEWILSLPDGKSASSLAERERMIVAAVEAGDFVHDWHTLEIRSGLHRALVVVSRDTLRIGEPGDSVRVPLSCRAQERVAELFGASLLTPRLVDLIYREAEIKPVPLVQPWWKDGSMAWTSRCLYQASEVDRLVGTPGSRLVANAGKDWVRLARVPAGRAANYGWLGAGPYRSVSGFPCWQSIGTAHDPSHVDYSQLPRFVSKMAVLDSDAIDLEELLRHPASSLIAHDGPFRSSSSAPPPPKPVQPAPAPRPAPTKPPPAGAREGDFPGIGLVQARNYTPSARTAARLVVVHSMEAAEKPTTAEAVAAWFAGPSAPKASAHFCLDSDSIVQCVRLHDVAWAAPGANGDGVHLELAGYARQTEADWLDSFGLDMLARAAQLTADLCRRFEIPIVKLGPVELVGGLRGICGHVDVSKAWHKSDHTDPGPNFPWVRFLEMVRRHA